MKFLLDVSTTFANPAGPIVQGVVESAFQGRVGNSVALVGPATFQAWITDNPVAPYLPTSALGFVPQTFLPVGTFSGNSFGASTVSFTLSLPFAFSAAPTTLYEVWEFDNPQGNITWSAGGTNYMQANLQAVVGGGTPVAV